MPFAGFDDWDECVMTMTEEEGHDQSAAERICGALQAEAKSEHGNVEELKQALERGRGLIADVGVELNSAVDRPAIDSQWVMFKSVDADAPSDGDHDAQIDAPLVLKQADDADARDEKRIAYAPAMIPREVDKEGDVVATPTVEKAAHDYLKNGGGVDSDHDLIDGKGEPVESWVEPTEKSWDLPDGSTATYPAGTWMVGIEWDKETWKRIQNGELEGLSIYGKADHVPLEKSEGDDTETDTDTDADVSKQFAVPFADEVVVHVVYESRTAATKASEEMGLGGAVHGHTLDGMDVFMPGETHEAFVDAYMDMAESSDETVSMAAKADGDPCWDGYTMVGTDENGDPRCVPDDDVPDAEGFENAVSMDGSGPPTGVTDKNDGTEPSAQDSSMSDTDIETRVDTIESTVQDIAEKVDDAVDTDKEPDGGSGSALRDLAAELANHEEVAANTDDIMSELKSSFLSDKENGGMDDDEDEEDMDDMESSAAKSADADDASPNFDKGTDGSESAAVAKDAGTGAKQKHQPYAGVVDEEDLE